MKISSLTSQYQLHNGKFYSLEKEKPNETGIKKLPVAGNVGKNPAFKSAAMATLTGITSMMQWIENQGYLISFMIQDGLGMTFPRTLTGFKRDKEITGKWNIQEGKEVFGREGLTGPYIMFVAPIVLGITGLFCKSTNTNTRLIKRLGENFKTMITEPNFNNSIKNDSKKFKEEFYKFNITRMYKDTVTNDAKADETIKRLLDEFAKYDSSKDGKVRDASLKNMVTIINEKIVENSSELLEVGKVKVGQGETKAAFGIAETLRAIKDFGNDAIVKNSESAKIDVNAIENMKNNFATKRLLTNITNIGVTLGGLAVLPKFYMTSDVSPSARAMEALKKKQAADQGANLKADDNQNQLAFKGRGINSDGIFAKIGKFLTTHTPEKLNSLLEYTGYNFTKTTFALLSLLGLLLPRGVEAWKRAPIDEKGKRDMTEIKEIGVRDTISSLSVVFAVPLLTKALVKTYENSVGYVLSNRASDGKNFLQKAWDIVWPYSNLEVLSIAELDAIYGNIDSKAKLMNFSNFIDKKGGDLQKILSKSENASEVFNSSTFTLDSIKNLSKKEKNAKIIKVFENLKVSDTKAKDAVISKLMKGSGEVKSNKIASFARNMNSLPVFISTFVLSPILLGWLIPELTYSNTRKAHKKMLEEQKQ